MKKQRVIKKGDFFQYEEYPDLILMALNENRAIEINIKRPDANNYKLLHPPLYSIRKDIKKLTESDVLKQMNREFLPDWISIVIHIIEVIN